MGARIGLDARLYYKAGAVFEEITIARDVTLNLEKGEADTSTRGSGGWRTRLATLKDASVEFEVLADGEDPAYQALADAFFNSTQLEMLVMDGDKAEPTSQGLRAFMEVFNFSRSEPLEEALTISVSVKPAPAATAPQWVNGPVT